MKIHILHEGVSLCRWSFAVPELWPEGHAWVPITEPKQATCVKCLERRCDCGRPLHYSDWSNYEKVQELVDSLGACVDINVEGLPTIYKIPRHYIALHGIRAPELDELAKKYGWEIQKGEYG